MCVHTLQIPGHSLTGSLLQRFVFVCKGPIFLSQHSSLLPYASAGVKKFLISFDDGDEIWTGLPAKDVRLAVSDLAIAGGVARDGVSVHVVSYSGQNCALA